MKKPAAALIIPLAIAFATTQATAYTILINGNESGPAEIQAFMTANFILPAGTTFVTGNFNNFTTHQQTIESADLVIFGRTISSADYQNGVADGYNTLTIPIISLTSYLSRDTGNRLGWHSGDVSTDATIGTNETTVSAAGAAFFGISEGAANFSDGHRNGTFNGLSATGFSVGGGTILSTIDGRLQSAYWAAGTAPGAPAVASPTGDADFVFPGERFLFNLDNDIGTATSGRSTFTTLTADGEAALIAGISQVSGLAVIPEPTVAWLGGLGALLLMRRRRCQR